MYNFAIAKHIFSEHKKTNHKLKNSNPNETTQISDSIYSCNESVAKR